MRRSVADGVVHAVDEHGHRQAEAFHARARSGDARRA